MKINVSLPVYFSAKNQPRLPKVVHIERPDPNPFVMKQLARVFLKAYFTVFTGGSAVWSFLPTSENVGLNVDGVLTKPYTWSDSYSTNVDHLVNWAHSHAELDRFVFSSLSLISNQSDSTEYVNHVLAHLGEEDGKEPDRFYTDLYLPTVLFVSRMLQDELDPLLDSVLVWVETLLLKLCPNKEARAAFRAANAEGNKRNRDAAALVKSLEAMNYVVSLRDMTEDLKRPVILFKYPEKPAKTERPKKEILSKSWA